MKCRISALKLSLLFACFFLCSAFLSSISSPGAFAASVKCFEDNSFFHSYSGSFVSLSSSDTSRPYCDVSSLDSSKTWYYHAQFTIKTNDVSFVGSGNNNAQFLLTTASTANSERVMYFYKPSSSSLDSVFHFVSSDFYQVASTHWSFFTFAFYWQQLDYIAIADDVADLFDCPACEECEKCEECKECEECQECPEGGVCNYDDKFDGVITAIYTVGAVALVVYFFYCIYRMIIGTTGGRP